MKQNTKKIYSTEILPLESIYIKDIDVLILATKEQNSLLKEVNESYNTLK